MRDETRGLCPEIGETQQLGGAVGLDQTLRCSWLLVGCADLHTSRRPCPRAPAPFPCAFRDEEVEAGSWTGLGRAAQSRLWPAEMRAHLPSPVSRGAESRFLLLFVCKGMQETQHFRG